MTVHNCKVAWPLTSQTLSRTIFSSSVSPSSCSNFDLRPLPLVSTEKMYQIRAYDFGVQFSFNKLHMIASRRKRERIFRGHCFTLDSSLHSGLTVGTVVNTEKY